MTAPHAGGWVWPPGLPAPTATRQHSAGDLPVLHPAPGAIPPRTLLAALRDGHQALAVIPANELAHILGRAAEALVRDLGEAGEAPPRDPGAATPPPPRDPAIHDIAANGRLSPEMARAIVGGMAPSWRTRALQRLIAAEFPDPRVLDGFVAETGRRTRAAAPPVTMHFGAGSVPGVSVTSMIRALLVKSAVLVKPGAGDIALTVRFARLLHRADPRLARAVAVQYWPGGAPEWDAFERGLLHGADQVVIYGSDATIESVRARAPASTRLIEHPHRIGVAIVDPGAVSGTAAATARAAALFEQRGCVSTQLVLLHGGPGAAARWCGELAESLAATGARLPPGPSNAGELSSRHQFRGRLAMKAAASGTTRVWSGDGTSWSVVLADPASFEPGGGMVVWVVPVATRGEALDILAPFAPVLQTVGLAGVDDPLAGPDEGLAGAGDEPADPGDSRTAFAEALFALGATRIVPLGQIPFPEPDWFHDGQRPLRELVRWGELR